jgi:hypothetical protein
MSQRLIERATDLGEVLKVELLPGYLFEDEQQAHKFLITCYRNGEITPISGSVFAEFVAVDANATYNLVGGIEGGKPYVILSSDCYINHGKCSLAIYVTTQNVGTLCVYACNGKVAKTIQGTQYDASGLMPDVGTLIERIDTAVANIPPAYGDSFAPPYTDLTFPVYAGEHCIYNGVYYRCKDGISTSEDFTSSHWEQVSAGSESEELFSAIAPQYADVMATATFPIAAGVQTCWRYGRLYINTVTITASEAWTSTHWQEVDISGVIANYQPSIVGTTLVFGE